MKKFRFECQKAINIPVNAISGINQQHLTDKYERLTIFCLWGNRWPNVNGHPYGADYCKNILAKKLVNQGETLVSSKPKMAFPIAAIIVALWSDHSDFGDLLLSHFYNVCPFTVPIFMPRMVGQSDDDYYKLMGYKYAEDGTIEKHDKFLKRNEPFNKDLENRENYFNRPYFYNPNLEEIYKNYENYETV